MKNETRKQIYFWGALWNLGFAFSGLAFPKITMWLISGSTKIITGVLARTFFAFFWVAVGVFGIGYYLVSRDPDRNEAVIWTGGLAKVLIFFIFGLTLSSQADNTLWLFSCHGRPHLDILLSGCPTRRKDTSDCLSERKDKHMAVETKEGKQDRGELLKRLEENFTETEKVILSRRSIRWYKKDQVPEFMVKRIWRQAGLRRLRATASRGSS